MPRGERPVFPLKAAIPTVRLAPRKNPRPEYSAEVHTGWVCGVCGANAKPDTGFTQIDPRYHMGYCPKHRRVSLVRG
jgi:hypothetical protein